MNRAEAAQIMIDLIRECGLDREGWTFAWMNRKSTLGLCKYGPRQLLLSVHYVDLNDRDRIEQTCRHEIAHALTPGAKHGPEWISVALKVGVINPGPCSAADMPEGRWQAKCPSCAKTYSMHRKPKARAGFVRYCPPCWKGYSYMPHIERVKRAELEFIDTAPVVVSVPRTPVRTSLSAVASSPVQTVESTENGAPKTFSAPQVAAAMGVDAKSFRAWLRKYPAMETEYKTSGAWVFPADRVTDIVRAWNATH